MTESSPPQPAGAVSDAAGPGSSVGFGRRIPMRKRHDQRDPRLPIAHLFSPQRARQLWESLPAEHRLDHFDVTNMPADYATAFSIRTVGGQRQRDGQPWTSQAVSLRGLPEPMTWELAWYLHQEVGAGHGVHTNTLGGLRVGLELATQHGSAAARAARSVTALSNLEWAREVRLARMRLDKGTVGAYAEKHVEHYVKRVQDRLVYAYHDGEWWRLDVWNPLMDPRIPQREHEPWGRSRANFSHLTTQWLREAVKWWLSRQLIEGRYVWSSVKSRVDHFKWFQWYLDQAGGPRGPQLVEDLRDLRPLMRGFVKALRQHRAMSGPNKGKPLGSNGLRQPLITVETFYEFMVDNAEEAASALNEPRWLLLQPQHQVLFRPGDKPRLVNRLPADLALEDDVVTQIAAGSEVLARAKADGGFGDEQAFRALMLQIRTGRRMNEILLMDFEPLTPLLHLSAEAKTAAEAGDGFVARMTYQQTKVESGQASSIPVDAEVVEIIHAQQQWARAFLTGKQASPDLEPRYLFLRSKTNRLGQHPYPSETYHARLSALTDRLAIIDSAGRPVQISKTHSFRHTRATNLINAGVPIHVVMRYFNHVTPTMTMHYAQTLAETAEREFLRYKKVTTDGRTAQIDPSDLFDLLHLDSRADRVLPNGWCTLPPKQACNKGNACLTCDKFVTDASHHGELSRQLTETDALVQRRQTQFTSRYGAPMGNDNIWLAGRQAETTALQKILVAIEDVSVHDDGTLRAVRGAGSPDRPPISDSTPTQLGDKEAAR